LHAISTSTARASSECSRALELAGALLLASLGRLGGQAGEVAAETGVGLLEEGRGEEGDVLDP
jgi:hypothetical protein